ncbi:MAG: zinc ribbon domain-containing protein [Acutalibacteraceae bacterium]
MFCKYCGKQINEDVNFCSCCGGDLRTSVANSISTSTDALPIAQPEDERKGMSIYFNDICRLEFIADSLRKKSESLTKIIEEDKKPRYIYQDYSWDHKNMFYGDHVRFIYGYDGQNYYFYVQSERRDSEGRDEADWYFWKQHFPNIKFKEEHKLTPERLKKLCTPITRIEPGFFRDKEVEVDRWDCDSSEFFYSRRWFAACWRDTFKELFEKAKEILPKEYDEAQKELKVCESELEEVNRELNQVNDLLDKEYSLNIIPNKFRTLEAVWYICDYYDSSSESLREILLHLDLDEIKAKLDTIIADQQQIIINQAIEIAQNEVIISQNQGILNKLQSVEQQAGLIAQNSAQTAQNTANAAKWAQIAANNAEACAWISCANYIRG